MNASVPGTRTKQNKPDHEKEKEKKKKEKKKEKKNKTKKATQTTGVSEVGDWFKLVINLSVAQGSIKGP